MAYVSISHRRLGEAAAIYRVIPDMHLSESNVKCVVLATGWPETRHRHAKKVSDNPDDARFLGDESVKRITDLKGLWREGTTFLDYYQMRSPENNVDKMCYAQFCKEYDTDRKKSKKKHSSD